MAHPSYLERPVQVTVRLGEPDFYAGAVDGATALVLKRAQYLEFPVEKYGKGFLPYKPITRRHIEISEAGAHDGYVLAECACFGDRDRRMIRRERSPRAG